MYEIVIDLKLSRNANANLLRKGSRLNSFQGMSSISLSESDMSGAIAGTFSITFARARSGEVVFRIPLRRCLNYHYISRFSSNVVRTATSAFKIAEYSTTKRRLHNGQLYDICHVLLVKL